MTEFNLETYQVMISTLREAGYQFKKFREIQINEQKLLHPTILMRHDVDFGLEDALIIAELEKNENITSTFFVNISSPLYNLLSYPSSEILRKINALGHDIALHFDAPRLDIGLQEQLNKEIEILKFHFPFFYTKIISFHQAARNIEIIKKIRLSNGTSHTYENKFIGDMKYFSDSKCQWRFGDPLSSEEFSNLKPLQILTHPIWWVQNGKSRIEKIMNFLDKKKAIQISEIENNIISFSLKDFDND